MVWGFSRAGLESDFPHMDTHFGVRGGIYFSSIVLFYGVPARSFRFPVYHSCALLTGSVLKRNTWGSEEFAGVGVFGSSSDSLFLSPPYVYYM